MKAHIELEYKVMINEDIYNKMLIHYDLNPIKQVNYYYSANKPYHAMRIMEKEGKFIFTLKVRENNYHKEYEEKADKNKLKYYKKMVNLKARLREFVDDHLRFLTDFRIDFTNNLAVRRIKAYKEKIEDCRNI